MMEAVLSLVLLGLSTTSCAGSLRGSVTMKDALSDTAGTTRVEHGRGRALQQAAGQQGDMNGTTTDAPSEAPVNFMEEEEAVPLCATLFVPLKAGNLTGAYTHAGRYNDGRPVYTNDEMGNNVFAQRAPAGPGGLGGAVTWFMTQGETSLTYFLSLESNVTEPTELDGLQEWSRVNDPECSGGGDACTANIRVSCTVSTVDLYRTAAPTPSPSVFSVSTANISSSDSSWTHLADNQSLVATAAPTAAPTSAAAAVESDVDIQTSTETSAIGGCVNLEIDNGGPRAGIYLANDTISSNDRPVYSSASPNGTDEVFSAKIHVCAEGWGVVNSSWAATATEAQLSANSTAREVLLVYAAESAPAAILSDAAHRGICFVDAWFVTGHAGWSTLEHAEDHTFVSISTLEDPSDVTTWAKFTPATATSRPTLERNLWIDVSCADAGEVEDAVGGSSSHVSASTAATTPAPMAAEPLTPIGNEPNARR